MLRPWRIQAPPHDICMPVLSPQQVMGSRCTTGVLHDWMATKALIRWQSESVGLEFWIGHWCLDRNWIWDARWIVVGFWIVVVVVCLFILAFNCTSHLLFLFTTLTFTTRL